MAALMWDGEFRLIKNAGHWPQWEQQEDFDEVVLDFLGRGPRD
jgi:2-hydroxy-6-oxonona-2,4-dienedioate hydrolase